MTDFLSQLVRRRETELSSPRISNKEKLASSDLSRSDELVQRAITYIIKSGLFDAEFYLASYPDIATAGVDPLRPLFRPRISRGKVPKSIFRAIVVSRDKCRCEGSSSATADALRFCWGQGRTASISEIRS